MLSNRPRSAGYEAMNRGNSSGLRIVIPNAVRNVMFLAPARSPRKPHSSSLTAFRDEDCWENMGSVIQLD